MRNQTIVIAAKISIAAIDAITTSTSSAMRRCR
jgi:hypothetical protein